VTANFSRVAAEVFCLLVAICGTAKFAAGQTAKKTEPEPVKQPIPFSHKVHTAIGLECMQCHTPSGNGEQAGLPTAATCMMCHETIKKDSAAIQLLAFYARDNKPIPWVRLYAIPEFVYFSHKKHLDGKIACEACHGAVRMQDVLALEQKLTMKFCIACHRTRNATTVCNGCHQLQL
jgi:hypothetical protein